MSYGNGEETITKTIAKKTTKIEHEITMANTQEI